MGTVRGWALDSALKKIAKDIIEMENNGAAIDVNKQIENWNKKHEIVPPAELASLQNDVSLCMKFERERELKSMNAIGYGGYIAEHYAETISKKAKELMSSPPSFEGNMQNG